MFFFFFFQAEDGIRDSSVTGVQTCALPICLRAQRHVHAAQEGGVALGLDISRFAAAEQLNAIPMCPRSEERRVGKGVDLGGRRIIKKKKKKQKKQKIINQKYMLRLTTTAK